MKACMSVESFFYLTLKYNTTKHSGVWSKRASSNSLYLFLEQQCGAGSIGIMYRVRGGEYEDRRWK